MGGGGVALLECTHVRGRAAADYHGGMEELQGGDSEDEGNMGPGALAPEAMYLLAISKAGEVRKITTSLSLFSLCQLDNVPPK